MAGISRVNGKLIAPKNFAGVGLKDFTLSFWAGQTGNALNADLATADGAMDQIFRAATGVVGSVSRVGTLDTSTKAIRFAVEVLGDDTYSPGKLGMGPGNGAGAGEAASIAAALQTAVQALGTVNGIALTSATVAAFAY